MESKKKINILIISIYYPPFQHIASNRIYSFAKYLDKDKFNIYILTIKNERIAESIDIPEVHLIREPNKYFFKKAEFNKKDRKLFHKLKSFYNVILNKIGLNPYNGWVQKSIVTAKKLINDQNIDIVISSYGPISPHMVALNIKNIFSSKIKWIADMRDEFPTNQNLPAKARNNSKKIVQLEKEILLKCDAITSVSNPILNSFKTKTYNRKCIFREIRNGFDFDIPVQKLRIKKKFFKILYAGSFHGETRPDNFFKVLEELDLNIDYRFEILGSNQNTVKIPKNIKNKVQLNEKVPNVLAINKMFEADLLLLIIPSNKRKGVYSGKLFEYLASLTPILALVPPNDVAAELISECNAGYIADYNNYAEIEKEFLSAYNDWLNNKQPAPNIKLIKQYHRKEQAKLLEQLIQDLVLSN